MRLIDADALFDKMQNTLDMQELYLPIHLKELVIDEMPTIDAVPVGCLELEKRDCSFADACDMGSRYARERERACENIIDWYKSPIYDRCLKAATERGFVQKQWK